MMKKSGLGNLKEIGGSTQQANTDWNYCSCA